MSLMKKYQSIIEESRQAFLKRFSDLKVGETFHLIEPEEGEDVDDMLSSDAYYELPFITSVTKHGFYDEFKILSITKKEEGLFLNVHCHEANETNKEVAFDVAQLDLSFTIDIAENY